MKKCIGFLLIVMSMSVQAQWVTIPDTAFAHFLRVNFPACINVDQLDTTCADVVNATSVSCAGKGIRNLEGIQYFDNLQSLDCSWNFNIVIPGLPAGLLRLNIENCGLSSLPPLPQGLAHLEAGINNFTSSLTLPPALSFLNLTGNANMDSLPPLPAGLDTLWCSGMGANFNTLPNPLPAGLIELHCEHAIPNFPPLPATLKRIYCGYNYTMGPYNVFTYTSFPDTLPPGMTHFESAGGVMPQNFTSLPPGLELFRCMDCGLTALPPLPSRLETLNVYRNKLTALPVLDTVPLRTIVVAFNQLTSLPRLPWFPIIWLAIDSNPITCLPPDFYGGQDFSWAGTLITCWPSYPQVQSSSPPLNSIPLCDLVNNPHGCPLNWNITGRVYFDEDSNCLYYGPDSGLHNVPVQLWRDGNLVQQAMYGSGDGVFSFDVNGNLLNWDTSQVRVNTATLPFDVRCPANNLYNARLIYYDSLDNGANFALECKPGYDFEVRSIASGGYRSGLTTGIRITAGEAAQFYGAACVAGISGTLTTTITGPVTYLGPVAGARTPTSVVGNTLTYNIADMGTIDMFHDFDVRVQTDTLAQAGQQVCITVSITPTAGDRDTTDNTHTHCYTVVNSYDPNDKQVIPAGNIDTLQEWLTYTVRFQNTGTADALNIHIDDTLDASLDATTFELLGYSHQPIMQITQNAVRFNFPNINLPDSTSNEPASHGYVQYRVKLRDNLTDGTTIENTAYIYFDFNPPVITNTVTNTITLITVPPCFTTTITTNDSDNVICAGDSITLTAVNPATSGFYQWSNGASTRSITVAHTTSGTNFYWVNTTDTLGCMSTDSVTIVVNPAPIISGGTPPAPPICQGDTTRISAPATSVFYLWSTGDTTRLINVAPQVTTDYLVTITNSFGCSTVGTRQVLVNAAPVAVINPGQTIICVGDSLILAAGGGTTYQWAHGPTTGAVLVAPTAVTTYTVTVSDANGCTATASATVSVGQPATASRTVTICAGDSFFVAGDWHMLPGVYQDTLATVAGCDSVVSTLLIVLNNSATSLSQTICVGDSYIFNGDTLNAGGIYRDTLMAANNCDSVITLTLTVTGGPVSSFSQSICAGDSYAFNNQLLTIAGIYYDTIPLSGSCDSVITLQLTVASGGASSFSQTICTGSSYIFNGDTLTTAGSYRDTLPAANSCDSIITLQLTITNSVGSSISVTICTGDSMFFNGQWNTVAGTYRDTFATSGGCDSIVTMQLSVNDHSAGSATQSICDGESYLFNGQQLTATGNYYDTLVSSNGCDSVITLALTVHPLPQTVITQNNDTLYAGSFFSSYQWLQGISVINNATEQSLHITQNGSYSVIVTDGNGCVDTASYQAVGVGVGGLMIDDLNITIYPNPNRGNFVLEFSDDKVREVIITDVFGKVVLTDVAVQRKKEFVLEERAAGVYFVRVADGSKVRMMKVVVD